MTDPPGRGCCGRIASSPTSPQTPKPAPYKPLKSAWEPSPQRAPSGRAEPSRRARPCTPVAPHRTSFTGHAQTSDCDQKFRSRPPAARAHIGGRASDPGAAAGRNQLSTQGSRGSARPAHEHCAWGLAPRCAVYPVLCPPSCFLGVEVHTQGGRGLWEGEEQRTPDPPSPIRGARGL